jgi:hypothetical protein
MKVEKKQNPSIFLVPSWSYVNSGDLEFF